MDEPVDKGLSTEIIDNHKGKTCPVILKSPVGRSRDVNWVIFT